MNDRKKFYANCLKPLSSKKLVTFDFVGFDVETYGDKNEFYMGGLYYYSGEKEKRRVYKAFYDRETMIKFMLSRKFMGKYIVATNLDFDLTKLFINTSYWNDLKRIERGTQLIYAEYSLKHSEKVGKIKFIDTTNYIFWSVEKLGGVIGTAKKDKPKCWLRIKNEQGKVNDYNVLKPRNEAERIELEEYNKYDCKISCDFMYFLQKGFNEAGGKLQITMASTSFDVWRRGFLDTLLIKEEYITKEKTREHIFKGYYGGRTEVYKKGKFKDVFYYDINSLYPAVMCEDYPLPQSVRSIRIPIEENIRYYEGVSTVKVVAPKMDKPFLPVKMEGKLIFPYGEFEGTYNHNELRYALTLGYKILNVSEQIVYYQSFKPFKKFVDYFYGKRLKHKEDKSPMELIDKLLLNTLYGKFGQKKITIVDIKEIEYIESYNEITRLLNEGGEIKNGFMINRREKKYNGKNSYPILASYTTSKARIKMYKYLEHALYTDTDSVICEKALYEDKKELGEMKLEGTFKYCNLVKPKLYYLGNDDEEIVKAKGLCHANKKDFDDLIIGKSVKKTKLSKLKESLRRGFTPYQKMTIEKKFTLIDNKRIWGENKLGAPLSSEAIKVGVK